MNVSLKALCVTRSADVWTAVMSKVRRHLFNKRKTKYFPGTLRLLKQRSWKKMVLKALPYIEQAASVNGPAVKRITASVTSWVCHAVNTASAQIVAICPLTNHRIRTL